MKMSRWLLVLVIALAFLLVGNIVFFLVRTSRQAAQSPDQRSPRPGPVVRVKNQEEQKRMEKYIEDYYRPLKVVQTLELPWGEAIDCVDMNTQPALQRPGMRDQQIQLKPSEVPPRMKEDRGSLQDGTRIPEQDYLKFGGPCPAGSIPVRRLTIDTLTRFETLDDFFKKEAKTIRIEQPPCGDDGSGSSTHEYAHARQDVANWGAESQLGLWNVWVEWSNEFSLSQIWVVRGSGGDLETLEAGWQSYYDKYGDWNAHLFIYFTPDNYGSGGCYNLDCSGFVQVDNSVYISGGFTNASAYGGDQYYIKLLIARDPATGNWWLWWFDTPIGYWPNSLFDAAGLANQAATVDFGGEIVNTEPDGRHTRTDMGSGNFPSSGWRWAGYQHNILYVDTTYTYHGTSLSDSRTNANCYDINLVNGSSGGWGTYFYFGGPGLNGGCP